MTPAVLFFFWTDTTVSVPIVPLTEENETAMEDEMFLSFLRSIGVSAPANEQVGALFFTNLLFYDFGKENL